MSKKMLKTLAVISCLSVGGAIVAQHAFAAEREQGYGRYNTECGPMMGKGPQGMRGGHHGMGPGRGPMGVMAHGLMPQFDPDRVLTKDQIRTISEARLIRFGNKNLKVGDIVKLDNGNYSVKIVTKDNSLVDTVEIDKASGRPAFFKDRAMKKGGFKKGPKGRMGPAFSGRDLNKDQIKTLAEAHVIRSGNENIKVGSVSQLKNGNYEVSIVTKEGSLVEKVEIDKSGRPAAMARAMEMRMGKGPMEPAPRR